MKVRVFFCKEPDPEIILRGNNLSRQALDTIYDLVWPFGIPLRKRRSHYKISIGDIIQLANDFYMVDQIGAKQIKMIE